MAMDLTLLRAKQNDWEGVRNVVYDDATGNPIGPSTYVKGNPSIGVGRNLRKPMSNAAIDFLWNEDAQEAVQGTSTLDWFAGLDENRQLAIVDMVFNMGLTMLQTFTVFLGYMAAGQYEAAADDLQGTKWYGQVGRRAVYLAEVIRTGVWA